MARLIRSDELRRPASPLKYSRDVTPLKPLSYHQGGVMSPSKARFILALKRIAIFFGAGFVKRGNGYVLVHPDDDRTPEDTK